MTQHSPHGASQLSNSRATKTFFSRVSPHPRSISRQPYPLAYTHPRAPILT
ncbi:hypothetical protein COCVIDRAFT_105714 [Bipolaris victoriae FI3]|uniref:Uncharacterized protein n=1 Tax=Bipolaris victoriae (strain FI3) TaxID=930091 RepID=W7EFU7_BIPV3|nr:hypothetical protein COCVIDRAFT_105714 [Bipolaris victoriae FI3]